MQRKSERQRQSSDHGIEAVPEPEPGINRVKIDADIPIFQMMLGEELSASEKTAVWVDSGNTSSTYALASAGSRELLHRVRVGRAFTAFQHFHIVNRVEEFLDRDTGYIVLPNIDQQYRSGVSKKERQDLFQSLLRKLDSITGERSGIKVLYSFHKRDNSQINLQLDSMTGNVIEIEKNSQGLRRKSGRAETMFYRSSGMLQTTIPYWRKKSFEKPEKTVRVNYGGENQLDV
jgi:hypothetical protein